MVAATAGRASSALAGSVRTTRPRQMTAASSPPPTSLGSASIISIGVKRGIGWLVRKSTPERLMFSVSPSYQCGSPAKRYLIGI